MLPLPMKPRETRASRHLLVRTFALADDLGHIAFEFGGFLDHLETAEAPPQSAAADQVNRFVDALRVNGELSDRTVRRLSTTISLDREHLHGSSTLPRRAHHPRRAGVACPTAIAFIGVFLMRHIALGQFREDAQDTVEAVSGTWRCRATTEPLERDDCGNPDGWAIDPGGFLRGLKKHGPLFIDGAHGEGGGQILRSALSISAITGRPLRIERIRAFRRKPGLAAQHLTAVRAAAAICDAQVLGDALGSINLEFSPTRPVSGGNYVFDVGLAREGGSAGAVMLILQTILLPLALATGDSVVELHGGTHMPWSPPFDHVRDAWLPLVARLGIEASVELKSWGWYPVGKGLVRARIRGQGGAVAPLKSLDLGERGQLLRVRGRAVAANLPSHIPQRMADRARSLLTPLGVKLTIDPLRVRAACPGAGLFLTAEYANVNCGFSAIGEIGKPSEQVAEDAVAELLGHHASGAALDRHLGDQILLPLCFARGPSRFSVEELTTYLETNAWVVEHFGLATITRERMPSGGGQVTVIPAAATSAV